MSEAARRVIPKRRPKLRFLKDDEIECLPPPGWLVDKLLPKDAIVVLFGPPACGKTFIAVDIALSIARNVDWQGRVTARGRVVYIAGEGTASLGKRVTAWKKQHTFSGFAGVHFQVGAVQMLNDKDVEEFISEVQHAKPVLIVVDTLNRCFDGEEDSARDMGKFVTAVDRLRTELGATILILHHPTKKGDRAERGSGALRGAADAMILAVKRGDVITMSCEKQKDAADFDPITLRLVTLQLDGGESSCVLTTATEGAGDSKQELSETEVKALRSLLKLPKGVKAGKWLRACRPIAESTFYRLTRNLVGAGLVTKDEGSRYALTDLGTATANSLPTDCHDSDGSSTATTPPPLLGG